MDRGLLFDASISPVVMRELASVNNDQYHTLPAVKPANPLHAVRPLRESHSQSLDLTLQVLLICHRGLSFQSCTNVTSRKKEHH